MKTLKLKKVEQGYKCKPCYIFRDKDGQSHFIEQNASFDRSADVNVWCDSLGLQARTLKDMRVQLLKLIK